MFKQEKEEVSGALLGVSDLAHSVSVISPEAHAEQEAESLVVLDGSAKDSGGGVTDNDLKIEAALAAEAPLDAATDLLKNMARDNQEKDEELVRLRAELALVAIAAGSERESSPQVPSPWALAVQDVVDTWKIDEKQRTKLLKNRTLATPELSSEKDPDSYNFPICWSGPKKLREQAISLGMLPPNPDDYADLVWSTYVPTWIKLLVRRHEIKKGVILIQPCNIAQTLRERMRIPNVDGYYDPPKSSQKKSKFQAKQGNLAGISEIPEGGAQVEYKVSNSSLDIDL
jgi:hypothetical protein